MEIKYDIKLAPYTSFKIGGNSKYFAEVKNQNELIQALQFAAEKKLPYLLLGAGSNILVGDNGLPGLTIVNRMKDIGFRDDSESQSGTIIAETGLVLPEIFNFTIKNGLVGFEKLATVPGTLGGAIYNNAHYQNSLLSDFVEWIEIIDPQSFRLRRLNKQDLNFAYDTSVIKTNSLPAVRVALRLSKGDTKACKQVFLELLKKRSAEQPYGTLNSGCMFQNVPEQIGPGHNGTSAGWLIQECGLKGTKIGGAQISDRHANFFINDGSATSEDMLKLAELCQQKVQEKYGVSLQFEIKII